MFADLFPFRFSIETTTLAGTALWSLALYLGFFPVGEWIADRLMRWFNFAERSLYLSQAEFDRTRRGREAQNAFYASILSIIPFLVLGGLFEYGVEWGLGRSWAVSVGTIACISGGVYELGRRDGQASKDD
ncbi:MAG: hypothetical protein J7641_18160 [Cyanobacteria bacterium SID2]|nr:hypothetical protein [Cyanobacteria bacterium SID2]MBP0006305.1 hypothetical protein [Cyanobacteria bacterium SBC]